MKSIAQMINSFTTCGFAETELQRQAMVLVLLLATIHGIWYKILIKKNCGKKPVKALKLLKSKDEIELLYMTLTFIGSVLHLVKHLNSIIDVSTSINNSTQSSRKNICCIIYLGPHC